MSWHNIRLILTREVRDQLRDRRTLFMMAVLPILLYPALGIGMMYLKLMFQEQPRTVVVLGLDELPREPVLISGDRFLPEWFTSPSDDSKLVLVTDDSLKNLPDTDDKATSSASRARRSDARFRRELKAALPELRELTAQRTQLDRKLAAAKADKKDALVDQLESERTAFNLRFSERMEKLGVEVLLVIPEDFARRLSQSDEQRDAAAPIAADQSPRIHIVYNSADDKSRMAEFRVREVVGRWEDEILRRRLMKSNLPPTWTTPVNPSRQDLAGAEALSATVWSQLFPALLVVWAVTGAFYPAIDLAAGEKERGTMETLLICPARRSEIVVGKFFTVMLFSVGTALLNLVSMGVTSRYLASIAGSGGLSRLGDLQPPPIGAIAWVVILLLPLSALFSALCLSLSTFARSTKEGQYYLTPLLMVTLGLTIFCLSPGAEISKFTSVAPVISVALLLKQVLIAPGAVESFFYAVPVLLTSVVYAGLALWWAIEQFRREDVLFREAEVFDLRLWLRHLMRDKGLTPSFGESILCFVMIMLLQFGAMKFMQDRLLAATKESRDVVMMQLLMIQQVAIVAAPALLMGTILAKSPRKTFSLYWPGAPMLLVAAALAVCLHPISSALMGQLEGVFPEIPESARAVMESMGDPKLSLGLLLVTFAVAPAVCEEIAFRGMILSGFRSSGRTGLAIALSSITFGVMHMIPLQSFNAALLGLVLGLICVRSGSLFPGIVFHGIYNGLQILRSRLDADMLRHGPISYLFTLTEDAGMVSVQYSALTLAVTGVATVAMLCWLGLRDTEARPAGEQWPTDGWNPALPGNTSH